MFKILTKKKSISFDFTRDKQSEIENLWNLGGFAATRFANNNGSGVGFNQIENGGSVLVNRKPLPLFLYTRMPKPTRRRYINDDQRRSDKEGEEEEEYLEEEERDAAKKRTPPSSSSRRRGFSVPGFQNCDIATVAVFLLSSAFVFWTLFSLCSSEHSRSCQRLSQSPPSAKPVNQNQQLGKAPNGIKGRAFICK